MATRTNNGSRTVTIEEAHTIIAALHLAAQTYAIDARSMRDDPEARGLVEQFERQARDCRALIAKLED